MNYETLPQTTNGIVNSTPTWYCNLQTNQSFHYIISGTWKFNIL